jgi:hypothetical protein
VIGLEQKPSLDTSVGGSSKRGRELTGLPFIDRDGLRASLALAVLILSVRCFSASSLARVFLAVAVLSGVFKCSTIGPLRYQLAVSSLVARTYLEEELNKASI